MKLNLEGKTLLAILNFWTESVTNFEVKMQMAKGYEKWKKIKKFLADGNSSWHWNCKKNGRL